MSEDVKDFSDVDEGDVTDFTDVDTVKFKVDGDVFHANNDLPLLTVIELEAMSKKISDSDLSMTERAAALESVARMMLLPQSAELFLARIRPGHERPIGMKKFTKIMRWLFAEYGGRPTTPAEGSSSGPDSRESGTSSTESTSAAE